MDNVAYVTLSDGRMIRVEAEHEGKVKVTLIYPRKPEASRPLDWASFSVHLLPKELWEKEVLEAYEAHANHDDRNSNPSCEHCNPPRKE